MNREEFKNSVYRKYEKQKKVKNDEFFNNYQYKTNKNNILRIAASMLIAVIGLTGGLSVYAAMGGTIEGKTVAEWLGEKFGMRYEEYADKVENKIITYEETELSLVSTMCDDGFTVLEFNLKLSDEDKSYLKLGEKNLTEEDIEEAKEKNDSMLLKSIDMVNTVKIMFNKKQEDFLNNYVIYIDEEEKWIRPRSSQRVIKISDNEYEIYQYFMLTEKEFGEKKKFVLGLDNIVIESVGDIEPLVKSGAKMISSKPTNRKIELDGKFDIELSTDKLMENSIVLTNIEGESTYKNMTKTIDKITATPMQTIVEISSIITDVSLAGLENTQHKDYIGLDEFEVYDQDENRLESADYEVKRIVQYADGTIEEWEIGDIGTWKNFYDATMELKEYLLIENTDECQSIKIIPYIRVDYIDENGNYEERKEYMEPFEITFDK